MLRLENEEATMNGINSAGHAPSTNYGRSYLRMHQHLNQEADRINDRPQDMLVRGQTMPHVGERDVMSAGTFRTIVRRELENGAETLSETKFTDLYGSNSQRDFTKTPDGELRVRENISMGGLGHVHSTFSVNTDTGVITQFEGDQEAQNRFMAGGIYGLGEGVIKN